MSTEFVRGAAFEKYGTSLYMGIGVPIPVLDEDMAMRVSIRNRQIETNVQDYGNGYTHLGTTNYEALRSGSIEIGGKTIRTAPMSSLYKARIIAATLKEWIERGEFTLTEPVRPMPSVSSVGPLKIVEVEE
jgi:uncharacterized protein (DUF39 family)